MADAAVAAPRAMFRYADAGAHADAAATFVARWSMELFFNTDVDGAEMDNMLPADFPIKRCGGGLSSVAYGDLAKVILPMLSVSPEVANLAVGGSFFSPEAWSRWWGTLQALMAAHRGRQREYPGYMQAALEARAAATEAQRAALALTVTDLVATETAPPAAAGAADPEDTRGFLMQLTYGSLGSQHGLLALARLTHGLGCHAGLAFRQTTGFRRGMHCLSQVAAGVTGLSVAELEPQEVAEAVSSELRAIAWGTEFEHLGAELGATKWTQLRLELALGRPAEWSKAATRARLLAERFHGVTGGPRFTAVAAIVRSCEPMATRSLTSPEACALAEEVAVRASLLRPGEPFTADVLAMLASKVSHMTEALLAPPWVSRTARERAEHVLELLRNSEANLAAADSLRNQFTPQQAVKDKVEPKGQGTIPKHFQANVGPAMMSGPYRDVKAAALARLAIGDSAAELDALQTLCTGVIVLPDGTMQPRQWSALITLIADGPKHGVNAELFDEEATIFTSIARRRAAELLGRTIGLQFAIDRATLHEHLEGYQATGLDEALSRDDWSAVDFGHAYRSAQAALRVKAPPDPQPAKAYASLADVEDALRIAAPVLALKGFPGNGVGTFPFALQQVCETWKLYGGQWASEATVQKLSQKGREYLVAFLKHLGQARSAVLSSKNPTARMIECQVPPEAHAAFQRHCSRLEGALTLGGYFEYTEASATGAPQANAKSQASRQPKGPGASEGDPGKVSVKVDWQGGEGTAQVTGPGGRAFVVSLPLLLDRAAAGRQACVPGMIGAAWGRAQESALCTRKNCGGRKHAWKDGKIALRKCEVTSSKKRAGAHDSADDDASSRKRPRRSEAKKAVKHEDAHAAGSPDRDEPGDDGDDDGTAQGASDEQPDRPSTDQAGRSRAPRATQAKGPRGSSGAGRGNAAQHKGSQEGRARTVRFATSSAGLGAVGSDAQAAMPPAAVPPPSAPTGAHAESTASRRQPAMNTQARVPSAASKSTHRVWVRAGTAFAPSVSHGCMDVAPRQAAHGTRCGSGWSGVGGAYVLRSTLMVTALLATPGAPRTLTVGDRRGRIRDASNRAGWPALSCDLLPCESTAAGFSYEGACAELDGLTVWDRLFTNMPCEQQCISLGGRVAAVKALDGRMWWGQAAWLRAWCIHAACAVAEQPDSYIIDFYDAQFVRTSPAEWGGEREKPAILFYRGTHAPKPPFPGRTGSAAWHNAGRSCSRDDVAMLRDELGPEMARALAEQVCPNGHAIAPSYAVEVERLAAAWWSVGLPLPADYNDVSGAPRSADDRAYAILRGAGDGRRLPGVIQPGLIAQPQLWPGVNIPGVSARGRSLGRRAAALRSEEAAATRGALEVPTLPDQAQGCRIRLIPVWCDGARLWFLLPVGGGTIGANFAEAAGVNAAQRKRTTAAAEAIAGLLYPSSAEDGRRAEVRCAPAAFAGDSSDGEAVCAAFVPPAKVGSPEERQAGVVWKTRAPPQERQTMKVLAVIRWYVLGWQRPQRALPEAWRTGASEVARTERGQQQPAAPLPSGVFECRLQRDLRELQSLLLRAAADRSLPGATADMIAAWAEKAVEVHAAHTRPPDTVLKCALCPDVERLRSVAFIHRCRIPHTAAVEPTWQGPRWPPGVPRPADFLHTFQPRFRREVWDQLERLRIWNADRTSGGTSRRPEARSWSDAARLPWLQGWVQDFRGGQCEALDLRGPAAPIRIHTAAALWYWREYPHRKLLSFLVHGVTLQAKDDFPLQTTLAPPLFALYTVTGGADAVVDELHSLEHERGWYKSGALPLTSPVRCTPRSATERVGGPPRGLAEQGWPRKPHATADTAEAVESLNVVTGKRRAAETGDKFYPYDESKPRVRDACVNAMILWVPAQLLDLSLVLITFDYKYFFHHLVYAARDIWKLAFELPGRKPEGGADGEVLRILHELVMSMGWTRASLIAQELADAIIWKLLRLVDLAIAAHVGDLRRSCSEFDTWWRARLALPESDYGTQARLHDALQYTDDKFGVCVGPTVAAHFLVCFSRLIGPAYAPHSDPATAARATAARMAHRVGVLESCIAQHITSAAPEVVVLAHRQPAPLQCVVADTGALSPLGNPYSSEDDDGKASVSGFACLCASGRRATALEVGTLLELRTDPRQAAVCDSALESTIQSLVSAAVAGRRVAVRCACPTTLDPNHWCHAPVVAAVVVSRAELAQATATPSPPDPVGSAPSPAFGLNMEAAKPSKWSVGGSAVWIGKGLDLNNLVVWVPEHKAAHALLDIQAVMEGRCTVARYEHLVGYLEDLVEATGGGHYRMKGVRAPLQPGNEVDDGPSALVRMRAQMQGRLQAWKKVLLNCPGTSMLSMLGAAPVRVAHSVIWEIGGDAALEGRDEMHKMGLGAFWYGVYWMVPISAVPGMDSLHIICLELLELGLGVVLVGPLLYGAARVQLVSDALVAVRTIQAETLDGRRIREAKSAALVAIHECITKQEEWRELHRTAGEVTAVHSYGERMLLHDAASRQYDDVIRDVCAAMRVSPKKLDPIPTRGMRFLQAAVAAAVASARVDPVVEKGPYAYGVEAIEHAPQNGEARVFRLFEEQLSVRPPVGAGRSLWGPLTPESIDVTDLGLRRAPRALLYSESTPGSVPAGVSPVKPAQAGPLASVLPRAAASSTGAARWHAKALRRLAAAPLDRRGSRSAGAGTAERSRAVVAAQALRAPPPILLEARAALHVARVANNCSRAPLLASAVAKDGLDGMRAALVERSLRDARGDEDGLGVLGASDDLLRGLLGAAMRALDRRFADSTRVLDKSYWKFWSAWCDLIGTPPLRTNVAANTGAIPHLHRREVAIALGGFMSFVAENCPKCKVSSMLARMRGVARRHSAHGLKFVSLSAVVMAADGLVQEHIDVHGADSLLPGSKEPLHAAEITAVLSLEASMAGQFVGGIVVGHNVEWQGVRVFVALMATMGCRKEAIALGPHESPGPRKLMLHNVTYRFDFVLVRAPTLAQLEASLQGVYGDVMVYVHPVPCKNDPTNEKFGNSPVPSRLHLSRPINLAREIIRYEVMRTVDPARRKDAPLVLAPHGKMWRKRDLDLFFKQLFSTVAAPARLARLSVHSFRVYLACSLLAAGATPEQIMQLLRWSSDSARKLYARLGEHTQVGLLESAADAHIDSVRSHTLLEVAEAAHPATREEAAERAMGEAVREGEALLDRALTLTRTLPTAAELRDVVTIDDDDVFATVRENFDAIRSAAARHDAREGVDAEYAECEGEDEADDTAAARCASRV